MCVVWLYCVCGMLYACTFMCSVCILFVLYDCIVCVVLYVCRVLCVVSGVCLCAVWVYVYCTCGISMGLCMCLHDMCGVGVCGL